MVAWIHGEIHHGESHFYLHCRPSPHVVAGSQMPPLLVAMESECAGGGRAPPVRYLCAIHRRLLIERRGDRREHRRGMERPGGLPAGVRRGSTGSKELRRRRPPPPEAAAAGLEEP
jgi:hypothetical protein